MERSSLYVCNYTYFINYDYYAIVYTVCLTVIIKIVDYIF